jgi:hypothetical protein
MELQSTGPLIFRPRNQLEDREAPRLKPAQAEDEVSDSPFIMTLPEDKVPPGPTKEMFSTTSTEEDLGALILSLNPA